MDNLTITEAIDIELAHSRAISSDVDKLLRRDLELRRELYDIERQLLGALPCLMRRRDALGRAIDVLKQLAADAAQPEER